MERRARRWRLPLAARIAAIPVLVAVAGALAFGFDQSDAAPAPAAAASKQDTGYRTPVYPSGTDPTNLPRGNDLRLTFDVGFVCNTTACRRPTGTIVIMLRKEDGDFGYWEGQVSLTDNWRWETRDGVVAVVHSEPITIPADKLQPGKYRIHHYYGGDQFFNGAEQPQEVDPQLTVNDRFQTSFAVNTSPNPSRSGEEVTYTATYNGAAPGGLKPTGNIFFLKDGVLFGGGTLANGTATWKTRNFPVGTSATGVAYFGDDNFLNAKTDGTAHTVKKDPVATTTELTITPNPLTAGATAHFTITVKAASGTAVPTGNVRLAFEGNPVGAHPLPANGVYEVDSNVGDAKEHHISAIFEPTGDFAASTSAEVTLNVLKADTTTEVKAEPEAAGPGKPVTLTAKVAPVPGLVSNPSGTITFADGDVNLGTCTLDTNPCAVATDKLPLGKRTVTASYAGDANHNASKGTGTVRVFEESTTKLTGTPSPATAGSAVTLNAQVAGVDPKITAPFGGKVTFLDGSTELGRGDVDKDGKATFSSTTLAVGTHSLTARFDGTDALQPSTSEKVSVQVNAAGTPGQGGGSQGGTSGGNTDGAQNGSGGSGQQTKNLASTGASIAAPVGIGALLLILGTVALTLGRRRRHRRARWSR